MQITNDNSCGWLQNLPQRKNFKVLNKDLNCDYLIIGAGYTGLSAARKLSEVNSNKNIIIVDAQLAGEGASGRNSGYLVDTTLNDGFTTNKDIDSYKVKLKIYTEGIKVVQKFIREHQVDCDWNESGKYFASSSLNDEIKVLKFSNILNSLNCKNKIFYNKDLSDRIGTTFYKIAVYTNGGILLNPGKLIRSMVDTLSNKIHLYENSELLSWKKINNKIHCKFKNNIIKTDKIIFCTNGFLSSLGIKQRYNFPLTLTASMTRPLNNEEYNSIGNPEEFGILPVRPMGATIRLTKDRRILIRNTAELINPNYMKPTDLKKRTKLHQIGITKRFPSLPIDIIQSSWSGVVCRSGNGTQIFEKLDNNVFVAGCYNGSGIGVGTLFGEQIALMASNQQSDEINIIQSKKKPNWLPPQPFLNLGIFSRLFLERFIARSEI